MYVVGVDGGQTSTLAVIADESGRLLGAGPGGPANHIHEPGGVERVRASLVAAVEAARVSAGIGDSPLEVAYLGMTGGGPAMEEVCRPLALASRTVLGHDSHIALYATTLSGPGVAVIGGTGSVAYGKDPKGESALAGGWGYLMGDEGSGYWIAIRGLNAATRAADGRADSTTLTDALPAHYGCDSLQALHRRIYAGEVGRPELAGAAETVGWCAAQGDAASTRILSDAGRELGRLAAAVIRRLRFHAGFPVGMCGGVFRAGGIVVESFEREVYDASEWAKCAPPDLPAAAAAALLALEEAGTTVDESVRANVRATLGALGSAK